jgi:hypothetical protein
VRQRLHDRIDGLSDERLTVADDFLAYLAERESQEATAELLKIPGFLKAFRAAEAELQKGRTVDWRTLRDDV